MMPGQGAPGGIAAGSLPGQDSSFSGMVGRLAEARARAARDHARRAGRLLEQMRDKVAPTDLAAELPKAVGRQRDWATLVSKLRKDFKQTRVTDPPEQYRRAIDQYFKTITQDPSQP